MAKRKRSALADLLGQVIVIDTRGSMIVIGRLAKISSDSLVLEDADVHDKCFTNLLLFLFSFSSLLS